MKRILICALALLLAALLPACAASAAGSPLLAERDGALTEIAAVSPPAGYAEAPELAAPGDTPEYYFIPTEKSPVRFLYYTTGSGDPAALAAAALESYAAFYEEFRPAAVREDRLAGRDCLRFDYTCAYPDADGKALVREQTAVAYVPLEGDAFIACIASLAFDEPDGFLTDDALTALLETALGAIELRS